MRLLSAVLFVALTGSVGFAEEPAPPPSPTTDAKPAEAKPRGIRNKVPLRVVKLLPETRQVLLFDKIKGTHVVAEVGQDVDGYLVDDIGDDEVTLVASNGTEVILAAPDPSWRRRQAERKTAATGAPVKTELAPEDPYGDAPVAAPGSAPVAAPGSAPVAAPVTPGADGVRVASATSPADTSPDTASPNVVSASPNVASASPDVDPGVAAFMAAVAGEDIGPDGNPTAPSTATPTTTTATTPTKTAPTTATTSKRAKSTKPTAKTADAKALDAGSSLGAAVVGAPPPAATAVPPIPTVAAAPAPAATATGPTTATIKRTEIDAALADFATTASTFRASFTKDGLRFDDVSNGSLLSRAGVERGDVVTSVDGQPLRSLDDAANLYARLPTARGTTLQVLRAGKPVTLRVSIQ